MPGHDSDYFGDNGLRVDEPALQEMLFARRITPAELAITIAASGGCESTTEHPLGNDQIIDLWEDIEGLVG